MGGGNPLKKAMRAFMGVKSAPAPVTSQSNTASTNIGTNVGASAEEQGATAPEDSAKSNAKKKKLGTLGTKIQAPVTPAATGIQI